MSPVPWAPPGLRLWRVDARPYRSSWDSGKGAQLYGGRWNPKGYAVVYASADASTALLEVAVHKGFDTLDRVPHVMSCAQVLDPTLVHVLEAADVPNENWLRPGTPGHAQQQFGRELLEQHAFLAIPSTVLPLSWNILFNPARAAGQYQLLEQTNLALDSRLNPPT